MNGVAHDQSHLASGPKVLFVLKEVNDLRAEGWDPGEFFQTGGRPSAWNNIAV